ncbi:MAG: GNAT family N-acetyltransferase [Paenibacillus dendritiformis]|uniref:GNAT family N-acetyltransferase n=1 Tax=Paenibacillus dendritiformis TaxID=130049 RepID=UPI001B2E7B45|nr:GNAT family N-acetyltransferase [Paenibacillus dendritiformis]MDU5142968.1 GNAT family N-acetyltransferase [Paenibacillus dendritiformis]GIO75882.1 GCN5 family N-acetyltransferase [Paenibacillus dendritiformis]
MKKLAVRPVTRDNWEQAIQIKIHEEQEPFVPTIYEALTYAYIKPWDEELDPFLICEEEAAIGFFYMSYTPNSADNYWIGGFQIDKSYQGKGYGKLALRAIIDFIRETHPLCRLISLTVELENKPAQRLYERIGFVNQQEKNQDGEVIYKLFLA